MIFNLMHSTALSGVEKMINSALAYDPATQRELAALAGRILVINSTVPPLKIAIEPATAGLILHPFWNDEADTTLQGSLVAIIRLALSRDEQNSFAGTGVEVTGDTDLLRQCNQLLRNLDVDWEALLAKLVGDVPAHIVGEAVRNSNDLQAKTTSRVKSAVAELAQEELKLNPSAPEFDSFKEQIRLLSANTDRLLARLSRIQSPSNQEEGTS